MRLDDIEFGDVVEKRGSRSSYLVIALDPLIAVREVHISNPDEWTVALPSCAGTVARALAILDATREPPRLSTGWLRTEGAWFFRVLGFGLWAQSYSKSPPVFSERHGAFTVLPAFGWRLRLLHPWDTR